MVESVLTVEYIVESEADNYFAERFNVTEWDNATPANRTKSLKQATRLINNLHFIGRKTDEDQINEWPRDGSDDIKREVKIATAEVAFAILKGLDPETLSSSQGKTAESVGDASVSYTKGGLQDLLNKNLGLPSPTAARILRPLILPRSEFRLERMG